MNTESALRQHLIEHGNDLFAQPRQPNMRFTGQEDADTLLNDLEHYPHAYVIACLMDRQIKAEKAWLIPHLLREKLGGFEFARLAELSQDEVMGLMLHPQPMHRFSEMMGENLYAAIQHIQNRYQGDAGNIWCGRPSSATLVRRFLEFKGIGQKIATMAANILVRDFKIEVSDRYSIDVSVDVHVQRTFYRMGLIPRPDVSPEMIIYTAREMNPEYPGVVDLAVWEIGRTWCKPQEPQCGECLMKDVCPTATQN